MNNALLIVAHGGKDALAMERLLSYYVEKLSAGFDEVKGCTLDTMVETIGEIAADKVYVMPLFVAEGYHTSVSIPEAFAGSGKNVVYLPPLGESEHIVSLIKERIKNAG